MVDLSWEGFSTKQGTNAQKRSLGVHSPRERTCQGQATGTSVCDCGGRRAHAWFWAGRCHVGFACPPQPKPRDFPRSSPGHCSSSEPPPCRDCFPLATPDRPAVERVPLRCGVHGGPQSGTSEMGCVHPVLSRSEFVPFSCGVYAIGR